MPSGTVKNWFEDKGFGFLVPDDGGGDVFVHAKALYGGEWLVPGDSVNFECQWDDRRNGQMKASSCIVTSGGKGRFANGYEGAHNGYGGKGGGYGGKGGYGSYGEGLGGYGSGKGDYFDGCGGGKGFSWGGKGGFAGGKAGNNYSSNGPSSGPSGVKVSRWQQDGGAHHGAGNRRPGNNRHEYPPEQEAIKNTKSTYADELYTTKLDLTAIPREKREEARRIADEIEWGKTNGRRGPAHSLQPSDEPPPPLVSMFRPVPEAEAVPQTNGL